MPEERRSSWIATVLRAALVAAVAGAAVGLFLLSNRSSQVQASVLKPEHAASIQTKDKLVVAIALSNPDGKPVGGTLRVDLVGPDGQSLAHEEKTIEQRERSASYRFELPILKVPADQLKLVCRFENEKFEKTLSDIILAKGHETALNTSQEFFAGSPAAIRCQVHGVKNLDETVPLPGAEIEIRLKSPDGKVQTLSKDRTGVNGIGDVQFEMPDVAPGQYKLEVVTRSPLGEEKLERDVKIKTEPKILLVTDKPIYQPGQLIHIRALALEAFSLEPVGSKDILFEVEDPKGNKVFKKSQKTSEYGVAAIDFQLADEVNMGDYQVRAILGEHQAMKTVNVKRYVLPRFKTEVTADKRFYLPKETMKVDLQTDYIFGKPVAGAQVKVTASTFDVQFKAFQTVQIQTDAQGHAKFEIKLPDYFVGQPLQKGNALVQLEVKITDTANHAETVTRTYTVSDQPIGVSLIPEAGRLVPGVENRVYAAAIYPDGSPAVCDVKLWTGQKAEGKPVAALKTNESGLAEFRFTPKSEQFRQGPWGQRQIEMLGGQQQVWGPQILFDMAAEARDARGNSAKTVATLTSEPFGENVLLRLDRAIYKGGESMNIDVVTTAGLPTVYVDVVKSGQTLLMRWLDVKDGRASHKLDLPAAVFGSLEVHAYQMLSSGEIIRDTRVVYVQPSQDLRIDVKADRDTYLPGQEGKIQFTVTDSKGNPTAAALGVIIVDEAVYALQEMQPGLEKVYFTLQQELLKPQTQVIYRPSTPIDVLIREPALPQPQQQIAQVLLAPVRPKALPLWQVNPALGRRQRIENQIQQLGWALWHYANQQKPFMVQDKNTGQWSFTPGILEDALKMQGHSPNTQKELLKGPFGETLTTESVAKLEKDFTVDRLAKAVTHQRLQSVYSWFINYTNQNRAKFQKNNQWSFPESVLDDVLKTMRLGNNHLNDAWGRPIKLVPSKNKVDHQTGQAQFDYHELVSAGPDGKFGTADDTKLLPQGQWHLSQWWWVSDPTRLAQLQQGQGRFGDIRRRVDLGMPGFDRGRGEGREMLQRAGAPVPPGAPVPEMALARDAARPAKALDDRAGGSGGGGPPPMRIREYFPETMLWQPSLITDGKGRATLPINFADSITTWRLTASGSSRGGLLGGVTRPLRVFQDFFVELDLPVSLTANDEVAFPVAVYNYLKTPQTVKIDLQQESWFELIDSQGPSRSLSLKPDEVTSVRFRIKAKKIGWNPLTVKAQGSKMSDAIRRVIEVVPDGNKVEVVVNDRLTGQVSQTITIPDYAVPDASKILVKVYPGVFSQVIEGTEGMLRMPFG